MIKLFSAAAAAALFAFASLVAPAAATVVIQKDFADVCREADMVFVGTVVSTQSRWRDESRRAIETVVTFAVSERIHGVDGSEVSLSFAGGEMDGLREVTAGVPQFQPGEEVVLFVSKKSSISPIVGFHQGCFRVVDGRVLDAESAPVTGVTERGLTLGKRNADDRGMPLEDFLGAVRRHLSERDGGAP